MTEKIDILELTPDQHQALVCMFFAMLPKTDSRYKKRNAYWEVLQRRFNKKVSTYNGVIQNESRLFVEPGQCAIYTDNGAIKDIITAKFDSINLLLFSFIEAFLSAK